MLPFYGNHPEAVFQAPPPTTPSATQPPLSPLEADPIRTLTLFSPRASLPPRRQPLSPSPPPPPLLPASLSLPPRRHDPLFLSRRFVVGSGGELWSSAAASSAWYTAAGAFFEAPQLKVWGGRGGPRADLGLHGRLSDAILASSRAHLLLASPRSASPPSSSTPHRARPHPLD